MSEVLPTSNPPICEDIPNVISSQESPAGAEHLSSLDGLKTVKCGLDHAPASRSALPESLEDWATNGTCGPLFTHSSPSAVLQSCLESRLRQRLGETGSPEYALTWKEWDMRSGPPICALRASGRRTSGNASTGWRTPQGSDGEGGAKEHRPGTASRYKLRDMSTWAGWPTPQTNEPGGPDRPSRAATGRTTEYLGRTVEKVTGWPTPKTQNANAPSVHGTGGAELQLVAGWATPRSGKTTDENEESWQARHERGEVATMPLTLQAQMSGCSIPTSQDAKNNAGPSQWERHSEALNVQASGTTQSSSRAGTAKRGVLNPQFSLWLMGFPTAWAVCGARVTLSSRRSRRSS